MSPSAGMLRFWSMLCLALSLPGLSVQQNTTINGTITTKFLNVCTLDRPPMSFCNSSIPSSQYTGLSLETFRLAALDIGLKEGTEFDFTCLTVTTTALLQDLLAENGTCDLAIASITITSERQALGVEFAYPYYPGSVGIMIKAEIGSASGWSFFEPFSSDLWIAIAVTMLIFPATIYALESFSLKPSVTRRDAYYGVEEATWRSLWSLQHGECINVTALGSRIAVLCFSFVALIIGSSYTANLAAFLTVRRGNAIRSVYDLGGLAVSSVPVYIPRLRSQFGIIASDANISGIADVVDTAALVAQGNLAAFLYDDVVSQYVVATFPGCSVRMLPDQARGKAVQPFDYGMAFKKGTDPALIQAFSSAILVVQENGYVTQFEQRFLLTDSPCIVSSANTVDSNIDRISFQSVYGLWVILLAGVAVGIITMLLVRWRRKKVWAEQAAAAAAHDGGLPRVVQGVNGGVQVQDARGAGKLKHVTSVFDEQESMFVR